MYRIIYERRVLKDLDKIPNSTVEKILETFKDLSLNPHPIGSKKLTGKEGLYRVKQGDYRVVYTVDYPEKEIRVVLVAHRKESYRHL